MTEDHGLSRIEFVTDFGEAEPNRCSNCEGLFDRHETECPACEGVTYGYSRHPQDEWTSQLVLQMAKAGAGYVAIYANLPASCEAYLFWDPDDGFQGYSRHPSGAWDSFCLGVDDVLEDARRIELRHCTDCEERIARKMQGVRR